MLEIKYEQPTIIKGVIGPGALANKPFPYNLLADSRRFEELIYSVYKGKLESSGFDGFDGIRLMSGVREKGRDCSLLKNGKSHGLIQCKKYASALTKGQFGEEITKFVLYSILDESLIEDPKDFIYYVAVSTGFVLKCGDYINDFKNQILIDPELGKWISKNISNPTLAPLTLRNNEPEVRAILSSITVKSIEPADLDALLVQSVNQHLIPLFFEVRTVTDNDRIDEVYQLVSAMGRTQLDSVRIVEELRRGSQSLKYEQNVFEEIPDSHIIRSETQELYDWINLELQKDDQGRELNVCLLGGNAGIGKTVILKDLYDRLTQEEIPVLGLKADKLYAANITELQQCIGLSVPVFDFIEECKKKYTKVIILIDQIDALSLSMSADRSYLTVFKSLIDQYNYDPNVRVIVSVRLFDLHYDPTLRLYKKIKTVMVSLLKPNQVVGQLEKLGIVKSEISPKLLELLRTPNHLNVFSRISGSYQFKLGITNVQGLYHALWEFKIKNVPVTVKVTTKSLIRLLYRLTKEMFARQRITVNENSLQDLNRELLYLTSERLIKNENGQIQFFHQSFYDYIFAKRFVEKNKRLDKYIKEQHQSIMIRSALKMIVNYLRDYDHQVYVTMVTKICLDPTLHFHIKHVLLSTVAFQQEPSLQEAALAVGLINKSTELKILFFEQAKSKAWLDILLKNNVLGFLNIDSTWNLTDSQNQMDNAHSLEKNYCRFTALNFLRQFVNIGNEQAWIFVMKATNGNLLQTIVNGIENWQDDRAYTLFERCLENKVLEQSSYDYILSKIAKFRPVYAFDKVKHSLPFIPTNGDNGMDDDMELLKSFAKSIPDRIFPILVEHIVRELEASIPYGEQIVSDHRYDYTTIDENEEFLNYDYHYHLLAICLRKSATSRSAVFREFLSVNLESKYESILRLIVFALTTNEKAYSSEIFVLLKHLFANNHVSASGGFHFEFRNLLGIGFVHFTPYQQRQTLELIQNLIVKKEVFVWREREGKPNHAHYSWGKTKYAYLLRVPREMIIAKDELKRQFMELERRFENYVDKADSSTIFSGVVGTPIPEIALQKMTKEQWIQSFKKYSTNNKSRDLFDEDGLEGGMHEHSWAFKKNVAEHPHSSNIAVIKTAILDDTVPVNYPVLGLLGLTEAKVDTQIINKLFQQLIIKSTDDLEVRSISVSVATYLVKQGVTDRYLIDYLISASKQLPLLTKSKAFKAETSIQGLYSQSINTVCGKAAGALIFVDTHEYEDEIFATLSDILKKGPDYMKAGVLFQFAYLMNLNKSRAFTFFSDALLEENNVFVIASALWSLKYMGNFDFNKLKPVFHKLVECDCLGNDDAKKLFNILFSYYLFAYPGAYELLERLIVKNPHARMSGLRQVQANFNYNEDAPEKCIELMIKIVELHDQSPEEKSQLSFLGMEHINIIESYKFVVAYINNSRFIFPDNLVIYLTSQCGVDVNRCIDLFNLALQAKHNEQRSRYAIRNNDLLTKFIVGAYSSLKQNDKGSIARREALLESFDQILRNPLYKTDTDKILDELMN